MAARICNLHNHTPFSVGAYDIDEICEAHLAQNGCSVQGVGISDHLFCTPSSREVRDAHDFERLFAQETRRYVEYVHGARQRWEGRLQVFCGCEIHWPLNKPYLDAIRSMLAGMDYVLFDGVDWAGLTQLAHQAKRWPVPIGLANTNVTRQFPNTSMDQVVRTLANARIFYEINADMEPFADHGRWFRILPQHRVLVSLGTDTHDDLDVIAALPRLQRFVVEHGLADKMFVPRGETCASVVA